MFLQIGSILTVAQAIWLKGSSGILKMTASPDFDEEINVLNRGFGVRGAFINVCVDLYSVSFTAELVQLNRLSL